MVLQMTGTRNLIRAPLTQARQPPACPTPGAGERLGDHNGLLFSLTLMPPGEGGGKIPIYFYLFLSLFYSYYPLVPGRDLASVLFSPKGCP